MARFYFHIEDKCELICDEEGLELPNLDAAIAEARLSARDFAAECIRAGIPVDGRKIRVLDAQGRTLFQYAVKDVIAEICH
jgi:hypothetical protein